MRKTAKLLAALLAILLAFSAALPVFGVNEGLGLPPTEFSFTIHKFIMADLDKAKDPNDGTAVDQEDPVKFPENGHAATDFTPDDIKPIAGVEFKLFKINGLLDSAGNLIDEPLYLDSDGNVTTTPWDVILDDFDVLTFTLEPDYDAPTKIMLPAGYTVTALKYDNETPVTVYGFSLDVVNAITMGPTDTNGISTVATDGYTPDASPDIATGASFKNNVGLTKGYYVVVETVNDLVASIVQPFIAAIPMTTSTGDGWIKDMHVYPKNGDISISKYIDRNAVYQGEKVTFDVVVSVPADIRTYQQFDLTDILDPCLTYTPGSLKVYGYKGASTDPSPDLDGSAPENWILFDEVGMAFNTTDYKGTASVPDAAPYAYFKVTEPNPAVPGGNSNTLTVVAAEQVHDVVVDLPKTGTQTLERTDFAELREYKFIKFEFECRVNEQILDRKDGTGTDPDHTAYTFENDAEINFKNKYDKNTRTRRSNKVRAHSAAIILDKIDAQDNTVLEGAEFKIASSEKNARAGDFLRYLTINGIQTIVDVDHPSYASGTDILGTAEIPASTNSVYYDAALWNYICDGGSTPVKSIVRFEGLKEFGTQFASGNTYEFQFTGGSRGIGRGGSAAADLEDMPLSRLPKSYARGMVPMGAPAYKTYWLVETKTPEGSDGRAYNLLLEPIEVTFTQTKSRYNNWYTLGSNITDAIRVRNSNRFTLPRTGGIGTILFTAGGVALIGVAVFLFALGKKKKKVKAN